MLHFRSLNDAALTNCWLSIGVFDGVHRGHQYIIQGLTSGAHAAGASAVVLTFDPHPAVVLGGRDIRCLTTPPERVELLVELGVDAVIVEPFTQELSRVSALDFSRRLKERLGLTRLLIGYDFALGRDREGNASRLTEIGRELGFTLDGVGAVGDETGVISSTEIRKLVSLGHVADAARLLGRWYFLSGTVVHGDGRGRHINLPTANLQVSPLKAIPKNGIYAAWATIGALRVRAAVNIGVNPTFTPDRTVPGVEAHFLEFDEEIYGQTVRLDFVARLRDELRFTAVKSLLEQIDEDVKMTRQVLVAE